MAVVLPFNRLLNTISHEMTKTNLQSLIHICQQHIPESKREEITHGWQVFQILKHQNVIGDDFEKAKNLLQIMRDMKPRRRDIIKTIKDFIYDNYDPSFEIESSGDSFVYQPSAILVESHHQAARPSCVLTDSSSCLQQSVQYSGNMSEQHCTLDCCCFRCNCYSRHIPSCVLLLMTVIMLLSTFLAIIFWFGKIPSNLYNKLGPDGQKVGPYIVGFFGVLMFLPLSWFIKRKVSSSTSHGQLIPYRNFTSDENSPEDVFEDQEKVWNRVEINGPNTLPKSARKTIKKNRRRPGLNSTTGDSSVNTTGSASIPVRERRLPPVTSRQMSYPDEKGQDGGIQTDGACCSEESDYVCHSRESLFPVDSDYSCDNPPTRQTSSPLTRVH